MGCYRTHLAIVIVYLCVNTGSTSRKVTARLSVNYPFNKSRNWPIRVASHQRLQPFFHRSETPKFVYQQDEEKFIPRLPNHYVNLEKNEKKYKEKSTTGWVNHDLPVFERSEESDAPIRIYRGRKAELIFNTVMSGRPFKMLEPIPGEVIHPPIVPLLKPGAFGKVGIKEFKLNNLSAIHSIKKNLIPFYAHEAIHPWNTKISTHFTDGYVNEKISDSVGSKNESEKHLKIDQKQATQIVYAIPYTKFVAEYGSWIDNGKGNHSQQESTTATSMREVTSPHVDRQIQAPSPFNSRIPNVTPPNFASLPNNNVVVLPPTTLTAPNLISATLNSTKHRIVYYAKSAGFKSYLPFPSSTRKKLHTAKHAHYAGIEPVPNKFPLKDTNLVFNSPNLQSNRIPYRIRAYSNPLNLQKLNCDRKSQQKCHNSDDEKITIMPRWYIRNQR